MPKAAEPTDRLADLPRFLASSGNRTLSKIVVEEQTKKANAVAALRAVLHQMEHGEASDIIDDSPDSGSTRDSIRDLRWCRNQIRDAINVLS